MEQKNINTKKRDLIQLSFLVHKLRNGHQTHQTNKKFVNPMTENHFVIICNTASS